MSRKLSAEEERLWRALAHPKPRHGGKLTAEEQRLWDSAVGAFFPSPIRHPPPAAPRPVVQAPAATPTARPRSPQPPGEIEPGRGRRIARLDQLEARLDLHGLDQDQAREALSRFIERAYAEGRRAVLVITGKGSRGGGVLRERTPDWLAAPRLRGMVAGVSPAHRRHGGEGALYVALKRRV